MKTEYEQYTPLKGLNPFSMTDEQCKLIIDIQKQHESEFKPLQPVIAKKAPFAAKYDKAAKALEDIKDIKSDKNLSDTQKQKKIARVWGSLSGKLLYDEKEMKKLCEYEPGAAALIPPGAWTPSFASELITTHAEIYDLLPTELQLNDQVIDAYRQKLMENPCVKPDEFHVVGETKRNAFFTDLDGVAIVKANPNCPKNKLITSERAIGATLGHICLNGPERKGGNSQFDFHGSKSVDNITPAQVMLATAQSQMERDDFLKIVEQTLNFNSEAIVARCARNPQYEQKIMPLLTACGMKEILKDIESEKQRKNTQQQKHENLKKAMFPYDENAKNSSKTKTLFMAGEAIKLHITPPESREQDNDAQERS